MSLCNDEHTLDHLSQHCMSIGRGCACLYFWPIEFPQRGINKAIHRFGFPAHKLHFHHTCFQQAERNP